MKRKNWQKSAKSFRRVKYGSPSLEWTAGLQRRMKFVEKYIEFKGKKVLDVGCGVGMFLRQFKKRGALVFGIDADKEKVKHAKKNFPNIFHGYAEKMPFRKDSFDIVWLHEVIEHVDDDQLVIKECFRVLKTHGMLVIFAPNRLWPFETHGIFIGEKYRFGNIPFVPYLPNKWYMRLTPHVRNYFKRDLFNMLKVASYRRIAYRRIFPGFDKLSSKIPILGTLIKGFFHLLDKTPLRIFGISHVVILEKL
jgi:2-polyprenyl-3-methyl-5-hydroxy-6-metoxy-1,4-benzoquinol methylase